MAESIEAQESDDLVQRLRHVRLAYLLKNRRLFEEAADAIERLRAIAATMPRQCHPAGQEKDHG